MKTERAPFAPITPDYDDKLERLAADKGVGALVKPVANRAGEGAATLAPQERPAPSPDATPRSDMKSLNLELPAYVWTELKIRAAQQQTSLKHVVMTALVKDGVTIKDADMIEDGRRLR
ncbi:hypothetical protein W911_03550 [Hyphomicrobium nitrativorans NL23]|uniref:Uncharacterized protein n=1 Tax=Hyphomicrobium nitrativorans NL23 TaxID=1029756 RepID=V5SIY1_9HYPH|nr:hypothetical protein [Hyphomicrobium nitrativorans]AHB49894.1 hypothetical protein W911_03550 [Hyphomicrobium nitrativorans NL23]